MAFQGSHRHRRYPVAALATGAFGPWFAFAQAPAPATVRQGEIVSLPPQAAALTVAAAERDSNTSVVAERGRQLVVTHPAAQCVRCHTVDDSESAMPPMGLLLAPGEIRDTVEFLATRR